jgi:hypothetical protein
LEPIAFGQESGDDDCRVTFNGQEVSNPYLDELISLVADGIFHNEKVEAISEILCRGHDTLTCPFSPPLAIYRRFDTSWYHRTNPDGTCGYKSCLQAKRRSDYRKKVEFTTAVNNDCDIDRHTIDSANVNLSTSEGLREFRDHICEMKLSLCTAWLSMQQDTSKAESLKAFLDNEIVGVINWLDEMHRDDKLATNSLMLPKQYWFDAQFLPVVFIDEDVDMIVISTVQSKHSPYGRVMSLSSADYLKFVGYIDYPSYARSVVSLNFFAYDSSHFYAQPSPKCPKLELFSLESAALNLSRCILRRLADYYRLQQISGGVVMIDQLDEELNIGRDDDIEINSDESDGSDTDEGCSLSIEEYGATKLSATASKLSSVSISIAQKPLPTTYYPEAVRAYIVDDEKTDKKFPLAFKTKDENGGLYGLWTVNECFHIYSGLILSTANFARSYPLEIIVARTLFTIESVEYVFCFATSGNRIAKEINDVSRLVLYLLNVSDLLSFYQDDLEVDTMTRATEYLRTQLGVGTKKVALATINSNNLVKSLTVIDEWAISKFVIDLSSRMKTFRLFITMCAIGFANYIGEDK